MKSPKTKPQNQPRRSPPGFARQQVLTRWRGLDLSDEEKLRRYRPKTTAQLAAQLVQGLKLDQRQKETELLGVWADSIDPRVTAHAQPAGLRNGTLFVNVDNSVWLDEIVRYRRHEILSRLQNAFGKQLVKRISFRLG